MSIPSDTIRHHQIPPLPIFAIRDILCLRATCQDYFMIDPWKEIGKRDYNLDSQNITDKESTNYREEYMRLWQIEKIITVRYYDPKLGKEFASCGFVKNGNDLEKSRTR